MPVLRVVSYNIRSLRDDPDALVRVVRALRPDVLCLQEVPRFWGWWGKRRRLAAACGMTVAAGRRACGLAVLAGPRVTPVAREFHLLHRVPGLHRRGLAIAALEVEGARLVAASTHLDLVDAPRRAHTRQVLALLERAGRRHRAPMLVAGDVNQEPGGDSWALLAGRFQDGYAVAPAGEELTFSSAAPRRRIDGIFVDPRIEVAGCGVPGPPAPVELYPRATDHRPVLAELHLP
ncbi:endonuclease/exonuclease/phosphatase family protein [Actinomadura kijaniata]|uniref:Endonuclease/exonuclease/phosphatase family metal-dependent hydrolase n=1 Tax=Actinomadura namibiensis TaxID=182080 RepID=A0A7W3QNF8_ACTNM|nr:endonuclease/exonuclease/phosphatase family protein [Actinomadura namibiensis]MBA8953501.1 endonuclease/exonuclease/phosphatase family metal-dependent hydrolase [Actinomadura namibiensis]